MNSTQQFQIIDTSTLTALVIGGYVSVMSLFVVCAMSTGRRLHQFAIEMALDRQRQEDALNRLFMAAYPEPEMA